LQKSSAFYGNVIGLDTMANPFGDNKHVWFVIGEKMELHIIAGSTSRSDYARNNHLCFSVPSVDVFTSKLVKAGIGYENLLGSKNEMTIRPDGVKQIYFKDPDGYWIEINDAKK
jgi:lactoylglutathione lyase